MRRQTETQPSTHRASAARRPVLRIGFLLASLFLGVHLLQSAREQGYPRVGFVRPLLYSKAAENPTACVDVTLGSNAIFGVPCCPARPGYDLASGLGSPLADAVASNLARSTSARLAVRPRDRRDRP